MKTGLAALALVALATAAYADDDKPEVQRTGNLAQRATVHYQSTGGTATPGVDFVALNGNLTFAPGVSAQYVPLTILSVPPGTHAVVCEMGARGIGHIRALCEVARFAPFPLKHFQGTVS